jgi:hypothetical protein
MTDHRSRRWFQVSLKSLFVLTLLVATFFAGYTLAMRQAEQERRDNPSSVHRYDATHATRADLDALVSRVRIELDTARGQRPTP